MKALITGASSGIGREIARLLAARGYELVLCARREDRLRALAAELPTVCHVIAADVADEQECRLLYQAVRGDDLEVVVNNAGFGLFGEFTATDLDDELRMIDTNIRAVHILTKPALQDFTARGGGRPVCGQGDRGAGRGNEGHDIWPPLCTRLPARARDLPFPA